ncbi:nucleotide-diphospho-sugar transferase [Bimuria novae-zelandiae CBS 107.79]|uniref:Nucleotide-diphospho-sugar transferase n=1 Tax=Bimuria novae-zelandiae CBS 107.79 TaxID=1447943 RepID=A0A6A5VD37_9PLEO|nr:nucleotide-diphospho-sugar transferase [Bimuria novae-zelandiae CBS 107.79]
MITFLGKRGLTVAVFVTILPICFFLTFYLHLGTESIRVRIGFGHKSASSSNARVSNDIYRTGVGFTNGSVPVLANGKERYTYVTFLSGTLDQADDLEGDNYFAATRILIGQLLHKPETRTIGIDVIVMVTPSVSESRRDRLRRDGVILHPVEFLHVENDEWIHATQHRWVDVMTKLRAWEMTQYSRILMLDGDTMLRQPLHGVFDDQGAKIRPRQQLENMPVLKGEASLPPEYLLGSLSEVWDSNHDFPPKDGTGLKKIGKMNAGFMLLAPSRAMFDYYRSLLNITNSFNPNTRSKTF